MHSPNPELVRELLRDPPAGLLLGGRGDDRLAQRRPPGAAEAAAQLVVALEERVLRQHDVGVAGDLARQRVDDDQQVEVVDRLQRLARVRQRVEDVRRVDEPALDRVGLGRQRRVADAGRDALVGERKARAVGTVGLGLVRLRVLGQRVRRDLHAGGQVEPALAAPVAEQRGQERDRAAALRVVAVPDDAPARVHDRRGTVARELARRRADQAGVDAGFRRRPLGRVRLDLGGELVEAVAVLLDERAVVAAFAHQHVHPREQQREVGAGPDRQPVLGLARGDREARVDDDDRDAPLHRLRELLHLRVVHVLAQVRADEHEAVGVGDVGRLGRAQAGAERQREPDVARTAALRVRRAGEVDRAPALQDVLEEALPDAVRDGGDGFGAVLRLDLLHLLGDVRDAPRPT